MSNMQSTAEQEQARDLFSTGRDLVIEAGAGTRSTGYPGYSVTATGEVWSHWRKNGRQPAVLEARPQRLLSPGIAGSNGYEQVTLYVAGRRVPRLVHNLVLEAFVGPAPPGTQARHRNGNERDNRAENLTWGTALENAADRERHGTTARGPRVGTSKLTLDDVEAIRSSAESGRVLARRFTVSRRQVGRIIKGEAWCL